METKSKETKTLMRNLPEELKEKDCSGDVLQMLYQCGVYY